jgi:CRP/FNR family cyclic AMP-dependent transcriptional regulator
MPPERQLPGSDPGDTAAWQLPTRYVDELAAVGTLRSYRANTEIISAGDVGNTMFVMLEGRVRVLLTEEDGREVLLNEHGPGEHFGEMMLDNGPRSATVRTITKCRLAVITREQMEAFLADRPDVATEFIRMLIGRIRALTRTVGSLALFDVYGRVANLLLERAQEVDGQLMIRPALPHSEIAKRIGASREMVSRIMAELRAGGYLETDDERILIRRPPPKSFKAGA